MSLHPDQYLLLDNFNPDYESIPAVKAMFAALTQDLDILRDVGNAADEAAFAVIEQEGLTKTVTLLRTIGEAVTELIYDLMPIDPALRRDLSDPAAL